MRVLDIGSGWGGLALYLAEACGAEVVGVTLSKEQHALSVQRAAQGGLSGQAEFRLLDYRDVGGTFDRVVSVGMFEHVGIGHYASSSPSCAACSPPTGGGPPFDLPFRRAECDERLDQEIHLPRRLHPGAFEIVPAIEKSGLYLTDIEVLRLHYAQTLREWRRRFADHRDTARRLMDERFCRMWEFYLASSECAFRWSGMTMFRSRCVAINTLCRSPATTSSARKAGCAARMPAGRGSNRCVGNSAGEWQITCRFAQDQAHRDGLDAPSSRPCE